jgi:hypothetical protein
MCFVDQLHRNAEAYVDDVVIKTRNPDDLISDLEEMFSRLRRFRWKLNPNKCIFGVPSGKLLGFIISNRGIEANPIKIMAITDMGAPTTIKDVQKLTGCMAALNRFISRLGERGLLAGLDARSAEAARVMCRSKDFVLVDSKLYRCGARSGVLMKCVTREDGNDILQEIHEGICGNHTASRTLVGKAYRAGFWWPTAASDAEDLVRRCQNCQLFGKQSHIPAHSLITIPPSWPFACWSLDMIGHWRQTVSPMYWWLSPSLLSGSSTSR